MPDRADPLAARRPIRAFWHCLPGVRFPALAALLGAVLSMGCGAQPGGSAPPGAAASAALPAGWVRECPGEAFCFSRPASLKLQPGQPIDSLTARYLGDGISLLFDMGRYGLSVAHLGGASPQAITIDGRSAQVHAGADERVLVVPQVHAGGPVTIRFAMSLKFDGPAQADLAQRIFQSITFKPPR